MTRASDLNDIRAMLVDALRTASDADKLAQVVQDWFAERTAKTRFERALRMVEESKFVLTTYDLQNGTDDTDTVTLKPEILTWTPAKIIEQCAGHFTDGSCCHSPILAELVDAAYALNEFAKVPTPFLLVISTSPDDGGAK